MMSQRAELCKEWTMQYVSGVLRYESTFALCCMLFLCAACWSISTFAANTCVLLLIFHVERLIYIVVDPQSIIRLVASYFVGRKFGMLHLTLGTASGLQAFICWSLSNYRVFSFDSRFSCSILTHTFLWMPGGGNPDNKFLPWRP